MSDIDGCTLGAVQNALKAVYTLKCDLDFAAARLESSQAREEAVDFVVMALERAEDWLRDTGVAGNLHARFEYLGMMADIRKALARVGR